jgi:WD40 repeat protein
MIPPLSDRIGRIDARCDRFETEWRAGRRPRIAEFLRGMEPKDAQALRVELVLLEEELSREVGGPSTAHDYLSEDFNGSTLSEVLEGSVEAEAHHGPVPADRVTRPEPADFRLDSPEATTPYASGHLTQVQTGSGAPELTEKGVVNAPKVSPADGRSGLSPGRTFGNYELLEKLAEGGMGIVYKARQVALDRLVAIKTIKTGTFASGLELRLFQREVEVVATLDHPNIVPVLEVGEQDGLRFFSMKLIDGRNLRASLDDYRDRPEAAARLMATLADALHHAHQRGILHRDLKPSNVLIDAEGRPHVIDFGLALRLDSEGLWSTSNAVAGTPCYMAPEQTTGRREETTVTDVYGLGTILYSMLTSRPPFQSSSTIALIKQVVDQEPAKPSALNPKVNRDLETICLKCLEKTPARRYATAAELAEDLRRFLDGRPIVARPVSTPERLIMWSRRRPAIAALSLAVTLTTAVGLGGIVYQWRQAVAARGGLQAAVLIAQKNEMEALDHEELALRHAYIAKINLAGRDWRDANVGNLRRLLEETRPGAGKTDLRGFEWYYLNAVSRGERHSLVGHTAIVRALAYHPGGTRLASCGEDGTIRIWEVATGRSVRTISLSRPGVQALAYHPDGQRLASGSSDKIVRIWDADTGLLVRALEGHTDLVNHLEFSPDGQRIASCGRDATVRVWDVNDGRFVRELKGHQDSVLELAYSPDGRWLASASVDGTVKLWGAAGGELVRTIGKNMGVVESLAFSPDSKRLATGDAPIRVWDPATGEESLVLPGHTGGGVLAMTFSPDGKRLVSAGRDKMVRVWDATNGMAVKSFKGHTANIRAVKLSPDGSQVASAGEDRIVRVWGLDDEQDARTVQAHDSMVTDVLHGPDGSWFVTASADKTVKVWDTASGKLTRTLPGHTGMVMRLSVRRDGAAVASAGADGTVRLWDVATGQLRRTLTLHKGVVYAVAFSPDGKHLASGGEDGQVIVCDPATGNPTWSVRGHLNYVIGLAFSPDGTRLASCGRDNLIRLWDAATGGAVATITGHTEMVNAVAFSPDGRTLASASRDHTVRLWDVASGGPLLVLRGHLDPVQDVAFSPDGRRLASVSGDRTLRIWDTRLGLELLALEQHRGMVTAVDFSPDGRRLLSAGAYSDRTVRIWEAPELRPPAPD